MSRSVGIDVSKSKLDICFHGKYEVINNDEQSLQAFFKDIPSESQIILEATGKYHRQAHRTLSELGYSVMVINPYQSRYFARAMNVLCKTDKMDARILQLFGEKMPFKESRVATISEQALQELSRHLDDLKKIKKDLESRRRESEGLIADSLDALINGVCAELKKSEEALQDIIEQDEELKRKAKLLESIPGVGSSTAIMLLSYLKELGSVSKREISALAGLAPVNNESGTLSGKRSIRRGRHDVRSNLYMPIVGAATRHNPRLKEMYERMVGRGKPPKVALTACMRKLVVWANAILETGQPWQENAN
tara:strand:+ start:230 stop:1153 length:924 start_codon:yes stop_codon:yes gene_type:complete